ncbi:MAG: hypothetical protein CMJ16_05200 [Peredibacter sp.]|nr:hypothetical protein [Peredibacter sp.]
MPKLFLILALVFTFNSYSQAKQYLNPETYFKAEEQLEGNVAGISYYQVIPKYDVNPDPERQVALEFYFGEYDGSEESKRQLEWIKELIDQDKATSPSFLRETLVTGRHAEGLEKSGKIDQIIKAVDSKHIVFDEMPEYLFQQNKAREPSAVKDLIKDSLQRTKGFVFEQRVFWTLVRGASAAGGVYAGLVIAKGVSPGLGALAAILPALASGSLTYHLGTFGRILTSGKWVDHLLTSEGIFARNLRKVFRLTPKRFAKNLQKNHGNLIRSYPLMNYESPEYLKMMADMQTSNKFNKIVRGLKAVEENLKWWLTEVAFVGIAFKAPQVAFGVSAYVSAISTVGDILATSSLAFLAQGPGDIAIQSHKFKKMEKLRQEIKQGKHPNPIKEIQIKGETVSKSLLEELDMVLSSSKSEESYTVTKYSHKALQRIEGWSRASATGLSFFSVLGVALDISGVPLATPLLISVGAGGGVYLAQVKGWVNLSVPEVISRKYRSIVDNSKGFVHGITTRYCQQKFLPRID